MKACFFLTHFGEGFRRLPMTHLVRAYVDAANLGKTGACHLFRHTMATLMLEGGADIRYIQAMLGHALLSTTQVYTHVSIRQLKHVHTTTHPAALLKPRPVPEPADDGIEPDATESDGDAAQPQPTPDQLARALCRRG